MDRNLYSNSTSPKKIEPNIKQKEKQKKRQLHVVKNMPDRDKKLTKEQKEKQFKMTFLVMCIFGVLLIISYRNSQINEKFSEITQLETELAVVQKDNQQLEVGIENSSNLSNIEKQAKEELGMQKATTNQTVYVTLPKKDYTEVAAEEVIIEENKNFIEKIIDMIFN